jgi:hypothetical protein
MKWACGVTSCVKRKDNLLQQTLAAIKGAGFPDPVVSIDGEDHNPPLYTVGNWFVTFAELWFRNPNADRFAMFQDDFVTYRNLRDYLEAIPYPHLGYCNLYTFPDNQKLCDTQGGRRVGWHESNQLGFGAVALVFSNEAARKLLSAESMWAKPQRTDDRARTALDGGIVTAYQKIGWKEYVHNPTLVQHVGVETAITGIGHSPQPQAMGFRGEGFDALSLLRDNPQTITGGLGKRKFVGQWQLMSGSMVSSYLRIFEDMTATRRHVPEVPGQVEILNDVEALITYPDGNSDRLVAQHDGTTFFYGHGSAGFGTAPRLKLTAIRIGGG